VNQFSRNLQSIFGVVDSDLEGTKQWRLNWWGKIWDYTVDGPYFWMGKGYGVNLADSDGFPAGTRDEPLRSPHSSHMSVLARSGVPGFVLWILLQIAWAASLTKSYFRARVLELAEWIGVFGWLLAYWVAFMVAASFDVFLEGPMAGIPYWIIFGLGWGAHILFQSQVRRQAQAGMQRFVEPR
jgi:hypothetical protein